MNKIHFILVFLLLFIIKIKGHPFPRGSEQGNQQQVVEYVDEEGNVVAAPGGGPPPGYEVVDNGEVDQELTQDNSGANAEVIDDINLKEFDQRGKYIGAQVSKKQTYQGENTNSVKTVEYQRPVEYKKLKLPQKEETPTNEDQDDYESNQQIDLNSYKKEQNKKQQNKRNLPSDNDEENDEVTQRLPPATTKDPYIAIEEQYPGIFEQLKISNTKKNNIEMSQLMTTSSDSLLTEKSDKLVQTESSNTNQETEYEYIEDKPQIIYDSANASYSNTQLMDIYGLNPVDIQQVSEPNEADPNSVNKISKQNVDNQNTSNNDVQHMDIHPGFNAHNPVIIQQVFGPNGTNDNAVELTEQKVNNQDSTQNSTSTNGTSSTGATNQVKYDETLYQPKRTSRILARYKVIIPVIVPNLRIRVPYEKRHSRKRDRH